MANEEQLKILKEQGVEMWNLWQEAHPDEEVDLSEADFHGMQLHAANLRKANLRKADLHEADLQGAHLQEATLGRADLSRADLHEADLSDASLRKANLSRANLHRANLHRANLHNVDLTEANLTGAKLRGVRLTKTILTRATITGADLYGTARDDWQIDGIRCDYTYWEEKPLFEQQHEEEQWLAAHRMPLDRDFRPGEFEELYKSLPTFEYYFEHGFTPLDPLIMDQVVQAINARHPKFELRLKNFEATGTPHATLTVIHKEHVETAKTQLTTDYEARLAALEGKQEQMMELFAQVVNNPQLIVAGDLTIGNKRMIQAGRDYLEQVAGDVTTGESASEQKKKL